MVESSLNWPSWLGGWACWLADWSFGWWAGAGRHVGR